MRKLAVVTGASSGIGKEFARKLALRGYDLLLVARRKDRLDELKDEILKNTSEESINIYIYTADLAKKEEIDGLLQYMGGLDEKLEVFINCAGFGLAGRFADTSLDREIEMIDVNVTAVHILTKKIIAFLKDSDKSSPSGKYILNVASVAGLFPGGPYMSTYYATKAYVASLTRAVAHELSAEKSDIHLSCLCPGPVNTEFNDVADVSFALKGISPEECVNYALKKMFKGKTVIVPTFTIKASVAGVHLLPARLMISMTARQQQKKIEKR